MSVEEKLKHLILDRYKSLRAFAQEMNMPYTTIDNILKRGIRNAGVSNVIRICSHLNIDVEMLGKGQISEKIKKITHQLSEAEDVHIKKYRALDEHGKEIVDIVLDKEHDRIARLEQERLERERAEKEMAVAKEKIVNFPITPVPEEEPETVEMKVYWQPAAAGLGNYLDDDGYDLMTFPADEVPSRADFGVRISGDSMEPKIYDGDIVWVKATPQIDSGEIGIFTLGGDALCKKLYIDYDKRMVALISLNPKYPPRKLGEYEELRTVGKVLGRDKLDNWR